MKVIHMQTTVQTVFGKLDDQGNVVEKTPVSVELNQLNEEVFKKISEELARVWAKLQEEKCPTPTE